MHSFIVTNWDLDPQSLPIVSSFPSLNHPDVLLIEPNPSITITQIRHLKLWLSRKPYQSKSKLALLLQAHTLTLPAQNALLKSLEEPPPDTIIILATNQPDTLIPTIHSRCQLINLESPTIPSQPPPSLPTKLGSRLSLAQSYGTKELGLSFCLNAIHYHRSRLKTNPQAARELRLLQTTHTYLKANVNPKLAIENLLLNL